MTEKPGMFLTYGELARFALGCVSIVGIIILLPILFIKVYTRWFQ